MTKEKFDEEYTTAVAKLAEILAESYKETSHSDIEPSSHYQQRIYAQIIQQMDDFKERFVNGYKILAAEIDKAGKYE